MHKETTKINMSFKCQKVRSVTFW